MRTAPSDDGWCGLGDTDDDVKDIRPLERCNASGAIALRASWLAVFFALLAPGCEFVGGAEDVNNDRPHLLSCAGAPDPLETGTGSDTQDCTILEMVQKYAHPDAMLVKSQIAQESGFNEFATSPDSPCGIKTGWTDAESKSYGLIQTTPACGEATSTLLPDGHPNLTQDMASPLWPTSIFNPRVNLEEGLKTLTRDLATLKSRYPGCTENDYNLMSAGAFNSGSGSVLGCAMYNERAAAYVAAVRTRYNQFALQSGWPHAY